MFRQTFFYDNVNSDVIGTVRNVKDCKGFFPEQNCNNCNSINDLL